MQSEKRFTVCLLIMASIWSAWLTAPYYIRGPLSYVKVHCNNDSWIPRMYWFAEHSSERFSSLLEPAMSTMDRLADYGMPTLFDLASALLPVPIVYLLLMWLQRFVAVTFTALLLSRVFNVPHLLAVLGGLLFSLGNTRGENSGTEWIYVHLLHEPGLPMLLYLACRIPLNNRWYTPLLGGLLGICVALTSQTEIGTIFTLPIAFLFAVAARQDIVNSKTFISITVFFSAVFAGFVFYQFPHLWAMIANASDSARSAMRIESRSFADGFGLMMYRFGKMWPQVMLGLIWLLFTRKTRRQEWALVLLLLVTTIAGTMLRPSLSIVASQVPIIGGFNFDRLFLYAPFFWICAAILALRNLPLPSISGTVEWKRVHYQLPVFAVLTAMLFVIVVQRSVDSFKVQWQASLALERMGEHWHRFFHNPELKTLAKEIGGKPVRTVTVGAEDSPSVWQPAYNLAYGLETVDGFKMLYPQRYHQFWRLVVDKAYTASNENLTKRFMDVDASRMYIFPPTQDREILAPDYNLNLLSLANVGFFISYKKIDDSRLSLRNPVYTDEMFESWLQKPLFQKVLNIANGSSYLGPRVHIYQNTQLLPRFRLVPRMVRHDDEQALLNAVSAADIHELADAVHVLAKETSGSDMPESGGTLKIDRYSLENVELTTTAAGTSVLVVSNSYSKFWTCFIDGQRASVFPAYHAFMGVVVPAGTHSIHLKYDPPYGKLMKTLF